MNPAYRFVSERAGHRCEYCHAPELVFNFPFEVEHIVPVRHGGTATAANLALACRSCNLRKGIQTTGVDPLSGAEVRLFDPRQDRWPHHFQAMPETGELIGLTPIGRATLVSLHMNSEPQMTARRWWLRLGLFP